MINEEERKGKLNLTPLAILKTPLPEAASIMLVTELVFAVFGFMYKPAPAPFAVMLAFTFTLFEAVNVSLLSALHVTESLIFTFPEPDCRPAALRNSMLFDAS